METKLYQRFGLVVDPQYRGFESLVNPSDTFSAYQNLNGKTYLKRVELLDMMFHVQNTSSQVYYTFKGLNQNMGFDVSGVYQPILRSVLFGIPRSAWAYARSFNSKLYYEFDMLTRCVDLGRQVDLTGLMSQQCSLKVNLFEDYIFTNLDWHTDAQAGGGVSNQAYVALMFTLETIEN